MEGIDSSLDRLGLDYVDMVYRPDPHTPTSTVVRAMSDIVRRSGLPHHGGRVNGLLNRLLRPSGLQGLRGWNRHPLRQPQYNMLHRDRFEQNISHCSIPLFPRGLPFGGATTFGFPHGQIQ